MRSNEIRHREHSRRCRKMPRIVDNRISILWIHFTTWEWLMHSICVIHVVATLTAVAQSVGTKKSSTRYCHKPSKYESMKVQLRIELQFGFKMQISLQFATYTRAYTVFASINYPFWATNKHTETCTRTKVRDYSQVQLWIFCFNINWCS